MKIINLDKVGIHKLPNKLLALTINKILDTKVELDTFVYCNGIYYEVFSIQILLNQTVILCTQITGGLNNSNHSPSKIEEHDHIGLCSLCGSDKLDLVNRRCCKCLVSLDH